MANVPIGLRIYLITYCLLVLIAVIGTLKNRSEYEIFQLSFWKFVLKPWKIGVFILGVLALAIPVEYLDFHSWDYTIAIFQPILSYLTAPWAVGVMYRFIKGKEKRFKLFVALCMMMFTGCWSVEIYLLLKNGYYMPDWFPNIAIGIVCYLMIGSIWNLEIDDKKQGTFSFMKPCWYSGHGG